MGKTIGTKEYAIFIERMTKARLMQVYVKLT